jgi:hypothetical protein
MKTPRTSLLKVRITHSEQEELRALAARASHALGWKITVSELIRRLTLGWDKQKIK